MRPMQILLMSLIMISDEAAGPTKINLYPYERVQTQSKCSNGLLSEYDKLVMKGFLQFDRQMNWNSTIQILSLEINASNSLKYATLDEFPFVNCLDKNTLYMTCESNGKSNAFDISINLKATERLSLSKLKIILSSGTKTYESQEQQLPYMYDSSQDFMYLNDQLLDPKRCFIDLSQIKQPLTLCCNKASPNLTMAWIERNGLKVQGSNRCAQFEEKHPSELPEYSFQCEVCNSYVYTVKCFTTFYSIPKNVEIIEKNVPGPLESVILSFVVATFLLVVWFTFKKKIRLLWKKDINKVKNYTPVSNDTTEVKDPLLPGANVRDQEQSMSETNDGPMVANEDAAPESGHEGLPSGDRKQR